MSWLARLRRRSAALRSHDALQRAMDEELRVHLELETEHLVATQGLSWGEARRRAALAFGGVERIREEGTDARGVRPLQDVGRDIRHGARALRKAPLFTIPAMLTLALGIGATTAVFSIVHGVLLRPLPFAAPERLVSVREVPASAAADDRVMGRDGDVQVSLATYGAWRRLQRAVTLSAWSAGERVLTGGDARVVTGASVTANLFDVLGVRLHVGRPFVDAEDVAGAAGVVVLGHALWRSRYGGDTAMIGRVIEIGGQPHTVVGVAAPGFDFPSGAELWTPLLASVPADMAALPLFKVVHVVGRLEPDVSVTRAAAELSSLAAAVPGNHGWAAAVVPLQQALSAELRRPLWLLFGAVLFVLLIACVNVGHLLLARGAARRHELAIRAALGAGRLRIVRALLTESLILATAACVLGVLAAYVARAVLLGLSPLELPPHTNIAIDLRVLGFALLLATSSGVLTGLIPAARLRPARLAAGVAEGAVQSTPSRGARRFGSALVLVEVALSLVLLATAGLLIRSFTALTRVDPGFDAAHVTAFELRMPQHRYSGWSEPVQARALLIERIAALPGVDAVSLTQAVPLASPAEPTPIRIEERDVDRTLPAAVVAIVAPGFFDAMGIDIVAGRDFADADADRAWVAIVNETFARTYFPGESPIGRKAARMVGGMNMREIIGVVADVRQTDLAAPPQPIYYTHAAQEGFSALTLVVRSQLPALTLAAAVRTTLRAADPQIAIARVAPLSDVVARSIAQPRFFTVLLGTFAAIALALAALGLYAMLSEQTLRRRHEIGVRLALGASPGGVVRLVLARGVMLTLVGTLVGIVMALAATRLVAALLFDVQPHDPATYAAVSALLLLAGTLASVVPALRLARTDPVRSLTRR